MSRRASAPRADSWKRTIFHVIRLKAAIPQAVEEAVKRGAAQRRRPD
jgi:hypothetical protein